MKYFVKTIDHRTEEVVSYTLFAKSGLVILGDYGVRDMTDFVKSYPEPHLDHFFLTPDGVEVYLFGIKKIYQK